MNEKLLVIQEWLDISQGRTIFQGVKWKGGKLGCYVSLEFVAPQNVTTETEGLSLKEIYTFLSWAQGEMSLKRR